MSRELLQHEPCQIELTERDLHNSRSESLLQSEWGGEASPNERRQIGVVAREILLAEDGVAFVTGMQNGRHPSAPYSSTTNIELVEVEGGRVIFVGTPTERYLNPVGTIHGG